MLAALVRKELQCLARDPHGLAALFLMPALFIVVMSLALRDVYETPVRGLPHAVDQRDPGPLAAELLQQWQQVHGAADPLPADWPAQLQAGRLKYVIVVDAGFSAELALLQMPRQSLVHLIAEPGVDGNLLAGLHAELSAIAGELKAREALRSLGADVGRNTSARLLVSAQRQGVARGTLPPPGQPGPAQPQEIQGRQGQEAQMAQAVDVQRPSAVQHNVPAWLVFGMFFVILSICGQFVQERGSGVLTRLLSLGVPLPVMLASKALPYLGVNVLQAALMLAVGAWLMPVLGGDALSLAHADLAALACAVGAISAAAVGLALMLACLVRSPAQAALAGPLVNLLMAALGGIMVPTFVMPAFMQQAAGFSPMNWGLQALLAVLVRGGDIAAVLPWALRLAAFAAVMLLAATLLFRRAAR
jgi:ABC-2 type transport system permease protein